MQGSEDRLRIGGIWANVGGVELGERRCEEVSERMLGVVSGG